MTRVLVYGLGIAGTSVARALVARGHEVVLADDHLSRQHELLGQEIGAEIFPAGDLGALAALVKSVDTVVPAPGVPETHPLFAISIDAQKKCRRKLNWLIDGSRCAVVALAPYLQSQVPTVKQQPRSWLQQ